MKAVSKQVLMLKSLKRCAHWRKWYQWEGQHSGNLHHWMFRYMKLYCIHFCQHGKRAPLVETLVFAALAVHKVLVFKLLMPLQNSWGVSKATTQAQALASPWTCPVCTYEHEGEEAEYLTCAVCTTLRGLWNHLTHSQIHSVVTWTYIALTQGSIQERLPLG